MECEICISQNPLNKLDLLVGTLLHIIYISVAVTDYATVGGGGGGVGIAAFFTFNFTRVWPIAPQLQANHLFLS